MMYGMLFLVAVAYGKGGKSVPTNTLQTTVDSLVEDVSTLHNELENLSAEIRNLRKEIDVLKLSNDTLTDAQCAKVGQIVEDACKEYDKQSTAIQRMNELSTALSSELTQIADKFRMVLNHIIVTINEQYKLSSVLDGTVEKNPDGIAHEVHAGETLDGIAKKYGTTKETLKSLNFVLDENQLPEGQMLFIPKAK